jgi:hypothetical protein
MATPVMKRLTRRELVRQGCCGLHEDSFTYQRPSVSLVMQLSTLGLPVRLRARGITLYLCEECVRKIHTKLGRGVRRALASAVQAQLVDIRRQRKG